jgi:hypothetical protein
MSPCLAHKIALEPTSSQRLFLDDRDLNAAKNINQLGQALPEVTPVESRALVMVPIMTKLNSRKQEPTRAHFCARER